ncbi:hypothetical protein SAMN04488498_15210 [Mesorhizobium albiziae]|uniref:Uncharacterized protein n=1 Tax=Neomesorhizobium albiziae TaxID=335020 RepID=A0A1I4FQE8_9HYPH|nr:hypothetical protein [Mesorhizobium albiziae]GLS28450.1 hypothetical protein GCM10007937_01570 [Mesorhizobium albiziae]SFL19187.1 hypothetical protein SAMN04488498_15210 [Mesorhizobium albiziae]
MTELLTRSEETHPLELLAGGECQPSQGVFRQAAVAEPNFGPDFPAWPFRHDFGSRQGLSKPMLDL